MFIGMRAGAWTASLIFAMLAMPAAADDAAPTGYATSGTDLDVSHTGYPGGAAVTSTVTSEGGSNYIVIEVEDGVPQEVGGETVIVVQEPEPVAATEEAPPPVPRTVEVARPAVRCTNGIWVDGHWAYADGQYVWVDGHCVVERVDYVFVHPRWDFYANVWWFVPGYYRPCNVWVGYGYHRPYFWFPPYYRPYYRGYRPVPVRRGPYRPTARPVPRPRHPGTVGRIPPTRRPVRSGAGTVSRVPTRTVGVSRAPTRSVGVTRAPSGTRPVTRSTTSRAPVLRSSPSRATSIARSTPSRTVTTRPGAVGRSSQGSRARLNTVSRTPSSPGRSSTVSRSTSSRPRFGGFSRSNASRSRINTVGRSGGSSRGVFGRPSMSRPMPSMRTSGMSRPSSIGRGGARTAPISRGR